MPQAPLHRRDTYTTENEAAGNQPRLTEHKSFPALSKENISLVTDGFSTKSRRDSLPGEGEEGRGAAVGPSRSTKTSARSRTTANPRETEPSRGGAKHSSFAMHPGPSTSNATQYLYQEVEAKYRCHDPSLAPKYALTRVSKYGAQVSAEAPAPLPSSHSSIPSCVVTVTITKV